MDLESIDELNVEQIDDMYNDVVDFGDETHLTGCCCESGIRGLN